jgi:recombination protein RecR
MLKINIPSLEKLVIQFTTLPGIGQKTAQRLALSVLTKSDIEIDAFAAALRDVRDHLQFCSKCHYLSEEELCEFCRNPKRQINQICVVENVTDVMAIENTNHYFGQYHVLAGLLSPLDGRGPDDLNIATLLRKSTENDEIILALPPSTTGESTAIYLTRALKDKVKKISRIAHGVPVGAQLDYLDEVTLTRAFEGRLEL